jgi:hypothetical protein
LIFSTLIDAKKVDAPRYEEPVTPTGWNYNGPHNLDTVPGKVDFA